jgi:hypothetical protein
MTDNPDKPFQRNPVFWLMFLLPGAAVAASFVTLAIAVAGADRALPPNYHWEGERLDQDFERARRAASQGIRGTLRWDAGQCVLTLAGGSDTLRLVLTHSIDAGLDRVVLLTRARGDEYRAPCGGLPAGGWRLSLEDDAAGWSLRQRVDALTHVKLAARDPGGSSSRGPGE